MLYDHALTFDDEVQLVWHARPSFAKYAFLYNRYSAAGVLIAVQYCACPSMSVVLKLIYLMRKVLNVGSLNASGSVSNLVCACLESFFRGSVVTYRRRAKDSMLC